MRSSGPRSISDKYLVNYQPPPPRPASAKKKPPLTSLSPEKIAEEIESMTEEELDLVGGRIEAPLKMSVAQARALADALDKTKHFPSEYIHDVMLEGWFEKNKQQVEEGLDQTAVYMYENTEAAAVGGMVGIGLKGLRINLKSPRVVYPRGPGAATGPVPKGHVEVSRWVTEGEAELWIGNGGSYIPGGVGGQSGRIYVTAPGAPRPGGTGPVRIDFTVDSAALNTAGKDGWFQIMQPAQNMPIYNVSLTFPPGR